MQLGFRIHHVGIVVTDLDAAVAFYGALLNMEVIERDHWRAPSPEIDDAVGLSGSSADGVMLRGPGDYLELWQYQEPARRYAEPAVLGAHELGLRHLAIEVEDVDAALDRVCELGGSRMGEPLRYPDGSTAVYCRDPFGNLIELMAPSKSMASLNDL